ncbi:cell division protein FtsQ/DivIB [Halopseudomonas pertucinogena]|uniref:Cell division protein FtsQ n=1 Tax=Halopseudomonas pertucinogena TaxID=86175 RepID=A0ABQ2CPL3_9GAMM|nr:cell division protein FtsQ/DivIB [Halopseudomonas pertucinogena]GGJ00668.1 cell division protein FtsQ [Halopseudomonas pertucinogena]
MGLMIRDPRSGRTGGRRSAPARGAVRVTPPAPRSWPRLSMPSWQGAGQRLQQWLWPLLLVILGMGLYELYHRLQPLAQHPISTINVEGDLQYIDRDSVQQIIAPYMDESLVTIDLEQLRADLLGMPWVAGATVTRIWPDRLVINLDEHLPIARWGDSALLNNAGRAFSPERIDRFQGLPLLNGPERAKRRVMQTYQQFNRLLRPYGHEVARLEMRDRGSWFLTTRSGIEMLLGRDDVVEKMQRFLAIDKLMLADRRELIARVDLRYSNGMAVAWREPATVEMGSNE